MGTVALITSGKGGAGKTTITVNLGATLAQKGARVVLVDFNMGLRNLDIYLGITGRDDPRQCEASVWKLLDPYGNNLNVSLSRIKGTFEKLVGKRIAKFYYVSGKAGEIRKVTLDRDLVIWEH